MKILKTVVTMDDYRFEVLDWPAFSEEAAIADIGCLPGDCSTRRGQFCYPFMVIGVHVDEDIYTYTLHVEEMAA